MARAQPSPTPSRSARKMNMKTLTFFLLFVIAALPAQGDNDGIHPGEWLPAPDAFVWPEKPVNAPEFRTKSAQLAKLPIAQRAAILKYWPEEEAPARVEMAEIDLNADGKPELFLWVPIYSGTGGPYYEILSSSDGKTYKSIGGVQGWVGFSKKKNGWYQIDAGSRSGFGQYTRYLLTFTGEAYKVTRNEGHNFTDQKVTIRKGKAEHVHAP